MSDANNAMSEDGLVPARLDTPTAASARQRHRDNRNWTGPIDTAARELSNADWIGTPPADDWWRLTLGEQQDYAKRVCRTSGAIYKTRISVDRVFVEVELPPTLAMHGLTEEEAKGHEVYLHNCIEDAIVSILRYREIKKGPRS